MISADEAGLVNVTTLFERVEVRTNERLNEIRGQIEAEAAQHSGEMVMRCKYALAMRELRKALAREIQADELAKSGGA